MTEYKDYINFNDLDIEIKDSTYINATQICKAGHKRLNSWFKLKSTDEFITELNSCNTKNTYIYIHENETLIHHDLAIQLAYWISPTLYLKIMKWKNMIILNNNITEHKNKTNEILGLLHSEREKKRILIDSWRDIEEQRLKKVS